MSSVRYRHHHGPIATGQRYLFRGLKGSVVESDKTMEVMSISVSGSVTYKIRNGAELIQDLFSARYCDILKMIEHGIWLPLDSGVSELYEVTDIAD